MKNRNSAEVPDLISVIVTTYNREDALEAVLAALSRQSDRRFEVVVADDGSRPETAAVVRRWQPRLAARLDHVWQIDCGFRAAEIRNRAIFACRGDYCVFLDGDCIAPARFHRLPSPAGRAGMVRHRHPCAALTGADRPCLARAPAAGDAGAPGSGRNGACVAASTG